MIQGVYHTEVTIHEVLEKKDIIEQTGAASEFQIIPREDHVHVMLYSNIIEKGKVQVCREGVINIWGKESKDLWLIVESLNRFLGGQKANEPTLVNELGAKPGFYISENQYHADKAELIKYHLENPNAKYSIMIRNSSGYGITSKFVEFDEYLKKWKQDYRY